MTVLEAKMYDTEMPHLLEQIEALERQRIEVVKGSIGAFSTAVRNLAPTIGNVCDTIDQSVAAVSPTAVRRLVVFAIVGCSCCPGVT